MAQETANRETHAAESVLDDMREWITGASPEQLKQWHDLATRVERLNTLMSTLPLTEEEQHAMKDALARARHHLNYRRPYTISVVGISGAGKSTLINALLGRSLVVFKYGRPTTGTIVTIRQIGTEADIPLSERALIRYHTRQSLSEAVQNQCSLLGQQPAYLKGDAQEIDINETLNLVRTWKQQGGGVIICPACSAENKPGARFCISCGTPFFTSETNEATRRPEALAALEDLLATALRQQTRLDTEESLALDSAEQIRQVQELMDEESPLNRDPKQRLIPLIQSIEYQVAARTTQSNGDALRHVTLTDVPGAAARATMHEQRLREQLDPFKTDAIILVMPPDRPELLTNQLLPLVQGVLMRGLNADQRRTAAERIFLVINKGDVLTGVSGAEVEQNTHENVEKVANAILPDFFQRYQKNIFFGVMALPALIAQLILAEPQKGRAWLDQGANEPLLMSFDRAHYRDVVKRARTATRQPSGNEQVVLRWSRIPELRATINEFLGRNRWQHALREAHALYDNACTIGLDRINMEWVDLAGKPLSANVASDLAHLTANQSLRYGRQLQAEANDVLTRFMQACQNLRQRNTQDDINQQIQMVLQSVRKQIQEHANTPEFKNALVNMTEHPIFHDLYAMHGSPRPLVELDKLVFRWFDQRATMIAATMLNALQDELHRENVEASLERTCYHQHYTETYLQFYREHIIGQVRHQYESACRGAILYQLMHRKVVDEVVTRGANFGQVLLQGEAATPAESEVAAHPAPQSRRGKREAAPAPAEVSEPAEAAAPITPDTSLETLKESVINQYTRAHNQLVKMLPEYLTYLFFYHLTIAEEQLREMVRELTVQLVQDAKDPKGSLYQKLQAGESDLTARAEGLIQQWQQIQALQRGEAQ